MRIAQVLLLHETDSLEIAVEGKILVATVALIVVTWLLYKLAEWLEPRK